MPRSPRVTAPGVAYHLLIRRVMRLAAFEKVGDHEAFARVLGESLVRPGRGTGTQLVSRQRRERKGWARASLPPVASRMPCVI